MTEFSTVLSLGDVYSYSRPDLTRVIDIHLELDVDFNRKVLKGKATLTIERNSSSDVLILDSYELVISSVTNRSTNSYLEYQLGDFDIYRGSKFIIQLPQMVGGSENPCQIEIEYETSRISPALHWLEPEQTELGTHPFLLSNNILQPGSYARAVFPCQDTLSVNFTYSAIISTPLDFTVLMSARLLISLTIEHKRFYVFSQDISMPSYTVIIAVGVLQQKKLPNSRISVWFDKYCYPHRTDEDLFFFLHKTEELLKYVENRFEVIYPWDSLDICLLPTSVLHFKIECPCLSFVSPFSIREYFSKPINCTISSNGAVLLS